MEKGIPDRGIRIYQGLGPKGEWCRVQGPRREEEAGKASGHHVVDALTCLARNFILSIN